MNTTEKQFLIWEAPILVPPEFRLYYDDKGSVVCYTCEKLPGNYIVIDSQTYASSRPDLRIIDGKISTVAPNAVVYKLMPDATDGIQCSVDDISIVVDKSYRGKKTKWKLNIYELNN